MDRETKELLTSMEKLNNRMLVDLSRVLAADQGKADARASRVVAVMWRLIGLVILGLAIAGFDLWRHW